MVQFLGVGSIPFAVIPPLGVGSPFRGQTTNELDRLFLYLGRIGF